MELQHILEKSASQKTNNKDTLSQIKETNIYSIFLQKTQNKNNINENEWKELDELVNKCYFDFKITLYRICKLSEIEYAYFLKSDLPCLTWRLYFTENHQHLAWLENVYIRSFSIKTVKQKS